MDIADAEFSTLIVLVRRVRDAFAARDDSLASSALRAVLDDLQEERMSSKAAQLSAAVRSELLGESAHEWLTRLLLRGQPASSELAGQILDALASPGSLLADGDGDEVDSFPCPAGEETLRLVPHHSSNPDWSMTDGRQVWAAGCTLAGAVLAGNINVEGKRVLELGCGLGAVGIACAKAGAKETILTDIDIGLLTAVAASARLNGFSKVLRTARLDWTDILKVTELSGILDLQGASSRAPFDIMLGADIIYEEAHGRILLGVVQRVLGEGFVSEVVFAIGVPQYREGAGAFASLLGVCTEKLMNDGCDAGRCQGDIPVQWSVESVLGQKRGRDYWLYHLRSVPADN